MAKHRSCYPNDAKRDKLQEILFARDLTVNKLKTFIGVRGPHLGYAVEQSNTTFPAYRLRMRVENYLGVRIWTEQEEADQLRAIGETLKVDLFQDRIGKVMRAARAAGVTSPDLVWPVDGFRLYRALIAKYFPDSKVLTAAHYHVQ